MHGSIEVTVQFWIYLEMMVPITFNFKKKKRNDTVWIRTTLLQKQNGKMILWNHTEWRVFFVCLFFPQNSSMLNMETLHYNGWVLNDTGSAIERLSGQEPWKHQYATSLHEMLRKRPPNYKTSGWNTSRRGEERRRTERGEAGWEEKGRWQSEMDATSFDFSNSSVPLHH